MHGISWLCRINWTYFRTYFRWLAGHLRFLALDFLINIPIGLLGIIVAGTYMPNRAQVNKLIGYFIIFAGGLVTILGLDLIAENFVSKNITITILSLGCICLVFYYFYAKSQEDVLLPLTLFQLELNRIFCKFIYSFMWLQYSFLFPLMLQIVFHYSAEITGWLMVPIALSSVLLKTFIARILTVFGYKKTLIYSACCMTIIIIATMSY